MVKQAVLDTAYMLFVEQIFKSLRRIFFCYTSFSTDWEVPEANGLQYLHKLSNLENKICEGNTGL